MLMGLVVASVTQSSTTDFHQSFCQLLNTASFAQDSVQIINTTGFQNSLELAIQKYQVLLQIGACYLIFYVGGGDNDKRRDGNNNSSNSMSEFKIKEST